METKNTLSWNVISIYYSRNSWDFLLKKILDLKLGIREKNAHFIICFSDNKGEHVQLAISHESSSNNISTPPINQYLAKILKKHPSVSEQVFPYGKAFWINYPNNTLVFNTFFQNSFYTNNIDDLQIISDTILELLDKDYSLDNFLSVSLFLSIQILKVLDVDYMEITLKESIDKIVNKFGNSDIKEEINILLNQFQVKPDSIEEILDSYWKENYGSVSFKDWLIYKRDVINKNVAFSYISKLIFDVLGLNEHHYVLCLELIRKWSLDIK